jgi:hypothetical protein
LILFLLQAVAAVRIVVVQMVKTAVRVAVVVAMDSLRLEQEHRDKVQTVAQAQTMVQGRQAVAVAEKIVQEAQQDTQVVTQV